MKKMAVACACLAGLLKLAAATAQTDSGADQKFTPPPPAEETAEIKALIDKAEAALKSPPADVSAILTDAAYMPAHSWPRFRKAIEKHAAKSQITLVTRDEPGTPLIVTGTVRDRKGAPVKGALLYVYHTSAKGWYSDKAAHISGTAGDVKYARLFGFLTTGADGQYEIRTIRPAGYPATDLPAHIHVEIQVEGKSSLVTEICFDDDPRQTPAWRERTKQEGFLIRPVRSAADGTQRVEADFALK